MAARPEPWTSPRVFVFFSSSLGCLASILVSIIGTLLLLVLLHVV